MSRKTYELVTADIAGLLKPRRPSRTGRTAVAGIVALRHCDGANKLAFKSRAAAVSQAQPLSMGVISLAAYPSGERGYHGALVVQIFESI